MTSEERTVHGMRYRINKTTLEVWTIHNGWIRSVFSAAVAQGASRQYGKQCQSRVDDLRVAFADILPPNLHHET